MNEQHVHQESGDSISTPPKKKGSETYWRRTTENNARHNQHDLPLVSLRTLSPSAVAQDCDCCIGHVDGRHTPSLYFPSAMEHGTNAQGNIIVATDHDALLTIVKNKSKKNPACTCVHFLWRTLLEGTNQVKSEPEAAQRDYRRSCASRSASPHAACVAPSVAPLGRLHQGGSESDSACGGQHACPTSLPCPRDLASHVPWDIACAFKWQAVGPCALLPHSIDRPSQWRGRPIGLSPMRQALGWLLP